MFPPEIWECGSVVGGPDKYAWSPELEPQHCIKGMMALACNPSNREVEAGRSQVQGHPQLP